MGPGGKKKDVADAVVQPPQSQGSYNGRPIPPEYALVAVCNVYDGYEDDELDFPTLRGHTTLRMAMGEVVLWNKADIVMTTTTSSSQPTSHHASSPGDGPAGDDMGGDGPAGDDMGGDDHGSSDGDDMGEDATGNFASPIRAMPPPDTSHPQGGGEETPPPSTSKCKDPPPPPKKPTEEEDRTPTEEDDSRPAHVTVEAWAAFKIAEDKQYKYSTTFERYMLMGTKHSQ